MFSKVFLKKIFLLTLLSGLVQVVGVLVFFICAKVNTTNTQNLWIITKLPLCSGIISYTINSIIINWTPSEELKNAIDHKTKVIYFQTVVLISFVLFFTLNFDFKIILFFLSLSIIQFNTIIEQLKNNLFKAYLPNLIFSFCLILIVFFSINLLISLSFIFFISLFYLQKNNFISTELFNFNSFPKNILFLISGLIFAPLFLFPSIESWELLHNNINSDIKIYLANSKFALGGTNFLFAGLQAFAIEKKVSNSSHKLHNYFLFTIIALFFILFCLYFMFESYLFFSFLAFGILILHACLQNLVAFKLRAHIYKINNIYILLSVLLYFLIFHCLFKFLPLENTVLIAAISFISLMVYTFLLKWKKTL